MVIIKDDQVIDDVLEKNRVLQLHCTYIVAVSAEVTAQG